MPNRRFSAAGFRSGLEEAQAADLKAVGASFVFEPGRIPYLPTKPRYYTPDFVLRNGIIVETKGYFLSADRSKHLTIREQHPTLDIRFVFARPQNRLGKKSTTTYAAWAEAKGFKWAEKRIPEAWIKEALNMQSLRTIWSLMGDRFPKWHT